MRYHSRSLQFYLFVKTAHRAQTIDIGPRWCIDLDDIPTCDAMMLLYNSKCERVFHFFDVSVLRDAAGLRLCTDFIIFLGKLSDSGSTAAASNAGGDAASSALYSG